MVISIKTDLEKTCFIGARNTKSIRSAGGRYSKTFRTGFPDDSAYFTLKGCGDGNRSRNIISGFGECFVDRYAACNHLATLAESLSAVWNRLAAHFHRAIYYD